MLEVRDLQVHYGRTAALRGVSLGPIRQGELVGVVGPNGAGKSTLLRALAGAVTPSGGSASLDGEVLDGVKPEDRVRMGLMLIPERRRIFAHLTVAENLQLGCTVRDDPDAADADLAALLERFPILAERSAQSAGTLSGGQQQQLAIARALASRPKLLLVDEPSLGLDLKMVDLVFRTLAELRDEGTAILLVEQNAHRTIEIADQSWLLSAGSIRLIGREGRLLDGEDLSSGYLGAATESPVQGGRA